MRFASLGGSNAGNYVAAGRAASNSFSKVFASQTRARPDYTGLNIKAMNTASAEKIAGMKAERDLTNVAQKVYADQIRNDIDIDLFNKKSDINTGLRKAGSIAAAGRMLGAGYLAASDNTKGRERPKSNLSGLLETYKSDMTGLKTRQQEEIDALGPFKPTKTDTTDSGTSSGASTSSTASGTVTEGIRGEAFTYLTKTKGLSRNKALGLIANIDRESGWDPKIMSGDDGGYGGLFQWKGSRQTSKVNELVKAGDWKGQIDYALSEPGEPYSQTYQETTFDSPQAAADGWMKYFERPADTTAGSKKHTSFLSGYGF